MGSRSPGTIWMPRKPKPSWKAPRLARNIIGADSPAALMDALEKPRRVLMMVPAGNPVDSAITQLKQHMEPGDILIDGGNSFFQDTERRNRDLEAEGYNFIGVGVSGGEEGALWGPSMMPGGQREAWEAVAPIFKAIAAKADDGQPCVEYLGPRGAGHYVKMVHNGIEYGDMQLIAEIYDILHRGLGLSNSELADLFDEWNQSELQSYLIEITADIFRYTDPDTGKALVDVILDEAAQKGTGKWTSQNALDVGGPIPTITAAVESRVVSSLKSQRVAPAKVIHGPKPEFKGDRQNLIEAAHARPCMPARSHPTLKGWDCSRSHPKNTNYDLHLTDVAKIWRAGCIIRASLLEDIMSAYQRDPGLVNLLLDDTFRTAVESRQEAWRLVVQTAVGMGIPVLALSASLAYFDAYRSERLPANLTQAQRDYFGAHTYRRLDREGSFHAQWTKE